MGSFRDAFNPCGPCGGRSLLWDAWEAPAHTHGPARWVTPAHTHGARPTFIHYDEVHRMHDHSDYTVTLTSALLGTTTKKAYVCILVRDDQQAGDPVSGDALMRTIIATSTNEAADLFFKRLDYEGYFVGGQKALVIDALTVPTFTAEQTVPKPAPAPELKVSRV